MTRLNLLMMFVMGMSSMFCIGSANGQDAEFINIGATIRGEIIDTTPEQNPIEGVTVKIVSSSDGREYTVTTNKDGAYEKTGLPAGRYTISFSKAGYGDRIGRSKVVAAGGEIFDRVKMRKKDNIITLFMGQVFTWQLVVGFALGFLVALIMGSGRSRV
ncbi:MAG: carboxypeptidase-like regulatory domain-containing protein [Candidatus Poribacteria bacterium]|nr:carboxypeptidase-like regulatory domain-containing protein [Candidatus Poribacteria bacterium]